MNYKQFEVFYIMYLIEGGSSKDSFEEFVEWLKGVQ